MFEDSIVFIIDEKKINLDEEYWACKGISVIEKSKSCYPYEEKK